jgi:hypothetical protein
MSQVRSVGEYEENDLSPLQRTLTPISIGRLSEVNLRCGSV